MNTKILQLCLFFSLMLSAAVCADGKVLPGYDGMFRGNLKLEPVNVYQKNADELGFMRNEIFAKYGRAFKTKQYRDYFSSKRWYHVNPDFRDSDLSNIDRYNIEMIVSFEKPKFSESNIRAAVLRNAEYTDGGPTQILFSDDTNVMVVNGNSDAGFYGENAEQMFNWRIVGDWIVAEHNDTTSGEQWFFRLDHKQRLINQMFHYPGK